VTRAARFGALVVLTIGFVGLMATPAFAHAVILQTTPNAGQVLTTSPKTITLRYNESVEADLGSVRVFDQNGNRVDTGSPTKPSADVVSVAVRARLTDGSYVVTWRVISADTHPVQGAFAFQVGTAANATSPKIAALATRLLGKETSDKTVGVLYGVDRGVLFGGLTLLLGGALFCVIVWPAARRLRRTRQIVWAGWIATAVATLGGILLQGPYGAALPLRDVVELDVLRDVVDSRFGHLSIARLLLLILAVPLLRMLLRREDGATQPRWWTPASVVVAVGIPLTISLAGHAHTGDYTAIAVPADVLHLLAMAAWVGGIIVLTLAVFPGRNVDELREVVPRFGRLGYVCVGTLLVTGTFQGWRQVRSLDALRNTDYGQLLIVKIAIVAVMLVFAARSRQLVRWLWPSHVDEEPQRELVVAGGSDDAVSGSDTLDAGVDGDEDATDSEAEEAAELRRLRGSVFGEVLGAVAVIVVTALLVNAVPANAALGQQIFGGSGVTLKSSKVWVDVSLSPGKAGVNDVHVSVLSPSGAPLRPAELTMTVDLPGRKIATINVPLRDLGPGHYISPGFDIPLPGTWRVTANVRLDEINEVTLVGKLGVP
jgi:copper transport protein